MIKLKEGVPTNLVLTITQKGMPYDGEVSFGIYDSSGEVIFSDTQEISGGAYQLKLPKMRDNDYKFVVETDEGYSDIQELTVNKSLRKSDKEYERKYSIDIDNEWDEQYEKNLGKNKVLMNEFYINNGNRLKKIEADIAEYGEKHSVSTKEIASKIEEKSKYFDEQIKQLEKISNGKLNVVETEVKDELKTMELSLSNELEGLQNTVSGISIKLNGVNVKIEDIKEKLEAYMIGSDKSISDIKSFLDSLDIPEGGVLEYTVEDGKVSKNVLWSSEWIDKRIKGEIARRGKGENVANQNMFDIIAVSGQDDVQPDNPLDTLTLAGAGTVSIATDADNKTITITGSASGLGDGDYGDITVSGTGTVWTIDDEAVTFAKMQHIAPNRILGRSTAGTGDIEALADNDARDIMGLATTDSPQFAELNVGHPTDTTITRVSAGVIAVEGATLATQAYAESLFNANDALVYKGAIDCSANPNYPAADAGHLYKVSVAGKIGGASGINVEVGDSILCTVDSTASGDQATVGANWNVIQANLDGAVIGPASSTDGYVALWDGTTGKLLKNSVYSPADLLDTLQTAFDKGQTIIIADTDNQTFTLTQNDTTNNPRAMLINNTGTGDSFFINHDGANGKPIEIDAETSDYMIFGNNNGGKVQMSLGRLSTASYDFYRNATSAETGGSVVRIRQDHAGDDQDALEITNDGTGNSIDVNSGDFVIDSSGNETVAGTSRIAGGLEVNAQTGTTYTLVLGDAGKMITLSNASAITLTVPLNSSVAFAVGTIINLEQHGAGQVTVAATGGVTINSKGGNLKLTGQRSGAYLRKTATDTWILVGDLSA